MLYSRSMRHINVMESKILQITYFCSFFTRWLKLLSNVYAIRYMLKLCWNSFLCFECVSKSLLKSCRFILSNFLINLIIMYFLCVNYLRFCLPAYWCICNTIIGYTSKGSYIRRIIDNADVIRDNCKLFNHSISIKFCTGKDKYQ